MPQDYKSYSEDEAEPVEPDNLSKANADDAPLKSKQPSAVRSSQTKRKKAGRVTWRSQQGSVLIIRSTPPTKNDHWWWIGGFFIGFIVGLMLSLIYGWVLNPRPLPVTPAELRAEDKAFYIRLIALAFAHNNNQKQAEARLAAFRDPNINSQVAALTEQYINQEQDIRDITALVDLSGALGQRTSVMAAFIVTPTPLPTPTFTPAPTPTPRPTQTPTPENTNTPTRTTTPTPTSRPTRTPTGTPTQTRTPTSTSTPTATKTPTPGPDAPFGVAQSVLLCDDNTTGGGLLRVYVRDRLGLGVPGAEVTITWPGGKDSFFTGFKPDVDPGYADFQMELGQTYQVELTSMETAGELPEITIDTPSLCPDLPTSINPSWQVVFQQGVSR